MNQQVLGSGLTGIEVPVVRRLQDFGTCELRFEASLLQELVAG